MTPGQQASAIVNNLLSQLEADALNGISGPLTNYFTSIAATPSELNVVVQSLAILPAIMAAFPSTAATAITQIANAGKALVALLPLLLPSPAQVAAKK